MTQWMARLLNTSVLSVRQARWCQLFLNSLLLLSLHHFNPFALMNEVSLCTPRFIFGKREPHYWSQISVLLEPGACKPKLSRHKSGGSIGCEHGLWFLAVMISRKWWASLLFRE